MSLHVPHVPEPANEAANKFARLLDRDGYGPTVAMRMIAAIVDHARAVRLRCDARAHLNHFSGQAGSDVMTVKWDATSSADRIVHGLAKHTTVMTRRDVSVYKSPEIEFLQHRGATGVGVVFRGEISEATRDAGHDLLASLICEVEVSP